MFMCDTLFLVEKLYLKEVMIFHFSSFSKLLGGTKFKIVLSS